MGRRPKSDKSAYYIDPQELRDSIVEMQNLGHMTERFAKHLLTIQEKVLEFPRYRNYSEEIKEELRSQNILRWVQRGWKSIKAEKNPFAYITTGCALNMLSSLERIFKKINQHRDFLKQIYDELGIPWEKSGYEEAEEQEALRNEENVVK